MDLNVLGIPQLYAYLIGWWQYDLWWAIMRDTGLFYFAIVIVFSKCIIEPFVSQEARAGSATMVKRSIVAFISLFLAIALFCIPSTYISVHGLKFQNNSTGQTSDPLNNDSTYAKHIPKDIQQVSEIGMPVGFYFFINLFNGATAVAYDSLADNTTIREAQQVASSIAIKNGQTRQEYLEFLQDCYQPAYADLMNKNVPDDAKFPVTQEYVENNGATFNLASNPLFKQYFYPKYRSAIPIEGFPFDASQDDIAAQTRPYPKYARPKCDVWWTKLSDKMYVDINKQWIANNPNDQYASIYDYVVAQRWWSKGTEDQYKSAIVETFLQKSFGGTSNLDQDYYSEEDYDKHVGSDFQKRVGLWYANYLGGVQGTISTLINMLPLIQMFLLAGVFALLPIGLTVGRYSFKFIATALCFIFALILCTYEWHLVSYIDNFLIESMKVSDNLDSEPMTSQLTSILIGGDSSGYSSSSLETIINLVSAIMYVVFPSITLGMFTWAGMNAGSALDGALSGSKSDAGEAGKGFNKLGSKVTKV
jgi:hypothetical protein